VAQALASCARRPLDFVCRWGGEEFAVVLPETDRHAAMKIADNILNAVRQIELQCTNGDQPRLTVSIGHVTATISPTDIAQRDLVDEADKAMLQSKSQGRNQRMEYAYIGY
jgi:diguanylate cyclase (GGDEF)-like protein